MKRVLILRPQPGAGRTAARARAMGLDPVVAPLFTLAPVAWQVPDRSGFDALILTSANAALHGGPGLGALRGLPLYAVGAATAEAARAAGLGEAIVGPGDGAALIALAAASGVRSALHLCGREHVAFEHPDVRIERRIVYSADPAPALPPAAVEALGGDAVALLHSPRAGAHFASLLPDRNARIAAISEAAAAAAGGGWTAVAVARSPRDQALLEVAAKLCDTGADMDVTR